MHDYMAENNARDEELKLGWQIVVWCVGDCQRNASYAR